jgi:hypothetical protein
MKASVRESNKSSVCNNCWDRSNVTTLCHILDEVRTMVWLIKPPKRSPFWGSRDFTRWTVFLVLPRDGVGKLHPYRAVLLFEL